MLTREHPCSNRCIPRGMHRLPVASSCSSAALGAGTRVLLVGSAQLAAGHRDTGKVKAQGRDVHLRRRLSASSHAARLAAELRSSCARHAGPTVPVQPRACLSDPSSVRPGC